MLRRHLTQRASVWSIIRQLAAQSAELAQELMGFDPQQTEAYTKWLACVSLSLSLQVHYYLHPDFSCCYPLDMADL